MLSVFLSSTFSTCQIIGDKGQNPNDSIQLSTNNYERRQFSLHNVISACWKGKKDSQTVKVSLLTCLKITGHELPASALSLIFSLHRDRSAATRSAVIRSVIMRSDCDFFTMFLRAPLSRWTFTDPYQICRSARLLENSLAIKSSFTNLHDLYFSWFGAHRMGLSRRMD